MTFMRLQVKNPAIIVPTPAVTQVREKDEEMGGDEIEAVVKKEKKKTQRSYPQSKKSSFSLKYLRSRQIKKRGSKGIDCRVGGT